MKTQYIEVCKDGTFYYSDKEMEILHRDDGPAIQWPNGSNEWCLNDVLLTKEEFDQRMKPTPSCEGKIIKIEGKKYKLISV